MSDDPDEAAEIETSINEAMLREFLDVDLPLQLRDSFPDASDKEIADVIAQAEPIVRAHGEQRVRDILRKRRH